MNLKCCLIGHSYHLYADRNFPYRSDIIMMKCRRCKTCSDYMDGEEIFIKKKEKCYIEENNLQHIILKKSNVDIIGSYVRTWIDREKITYKYEFKSEGRRSYYNPEELIIEK